MFPTSTLSSTILIATSETTNGQAATLMNDLLQVRAIFYRSRNRKSSEASL